MALLTPHMETGSENIGHRNGLCKYCKENCTLMNNLNFVNGSSNKAVEWVFIYK